MQLITRENIINILREVEISADIDSLDPSEPLPAQDVDSLDMMNILFGLEETFSIKITDESIAEGNWLKIDDMVQNVSTLIAQKESGA